MATYSRNISLRQSFMQILTRKSLIVKHTKRLKGNNLFRAMTRLVLEYMDWLTEEPVAEEAADDIAAGMRIAQLKKVEKKALTLQDRSILLIKPEERSLDNRKYIHDFFRRFHVFRKYPDHVRETLAGVCCYQYLKAGRVIVRQGRPAENLYFIIYGEVAISKTVPERWTGELETIPMGVLNVGDIFGEIALLHRIPRSATAVSNTTVELIIIPRQDFDEVLRKHLQKEWDILQDAMIHFNYFKSWDEEEIRECCILSRMHVFQPDEIVLGDGKGMVNYVHFLVEGECQLIEHMVVREKRTIRGMHYELYDPKKSTASGGIRHSSKLPDMDEMKFMFDINDGSNLDLTRSEETEDYSRLLQPSKAADRRVDTERASIITTTLYEAITQWQKITDVAEALLREPSTISQQCYPNDVRTIFMQVCTFYRGACFGLGEDMRNRRIVAATAATFLLVPRHWLSAHNRANIWERVKLFLNSKFPSKEELFNRFARDRKFVADASALTRLPEWTEYKRSLLDDVGKRGRRIHSNVTVHDIPYSIRIVNDMDITQ